MGEKPEPPFDPDEPQDASLGAWEWPSNAEPVPGHGTHNDRVWAVATHLSIFGLGIVLPLVVVLWRGDRSPYVCHHAAEAVNFHTTVLLAVFLCSLTSVALIGVLLLPLVLAVAATLAVKAAIRSSHGAWHRYPLTLRLVS